VYPKRLRFPPTAHVGRHSFDDESRALSRQSKSGRA
jgi:hypothetical protein